MYLEEAITELKKQVTTLTSEVSKLSVLIRQSVSDTPATIIEEQAETEATIDKVDAPKEKNKAKPKDDVVEEINTIDYIKKLILTKIQANVPRKKIQEVIAKCGGSDDAKLATLNPYQLLTALADIKEL